MGNRGKNATDGPRDQGAAGGEARESSETKWANAVALLDVLEAIARLERKLGALPGLTVDVKGAAALLHTTARAIYVRHQRGQMPRPLPGRRLVWRTADLLATKGDRPKT